MLHFSTLPRFSWACVNVVVQSLSCVRLFVTPWTATCQAPLSFTISRSFLKLMSIESVMPSNHLIFAAPFSFIPSIRDFSWWVGSLHQVAKVLELQLQHQSFQWIFRVGFLQDWLVWSPCCQGTLRSFLQYHNSKASVLQCSAFFMVQLSYPYMTTGKTIALTRRTYVSEMLSRLVIAFLPRSKHLLISWLQSPSAVILEPKKIKSVTVSISIFHEVMGPNAMIFIFWMLSFKPGFSLSSFTFIKRLFSSSSLFAIRVVSSAWGYWYFSWQSWFQLVLHPAWHFTWCALHIS